MQIESLIKKNIKLEKKVEQLTNEEADIVKVGSKIGESIKKIHGSKEWPPNPNDVHKDHVALPSCLETFLNTVITGSPEANFNTAKMLPILSLGQDLINTISNEHNIPPKHILIAAAI